MLIQRQARIIPQGRQDVCDGRAPVKAAAIDEPGGDVAGDDRLFMDIRQGEDPFEVAFSQEGSAVVDKASDQKVIIV
jgi:hypothetical protein